MQKRMSMLALVSFLAVSCSTAPDVSGMESQTEFPSEKVSDLSSSRESMPSPTRSALQVVPRNWVGELIELGYVAGEDGGQWLDDRMIDDAARFCLTSVSGYGDDRVAKAFKQTEFEYAVVRRSRAADPMLELKYVKKVIERFCDDRLEALNTVIRMHPEMQVLVDDI